MVSSLSLFPDTVNRTFNQLFCQAFCGFSSTISFIKSNLIAENSFSPPPHGIEERHHPSPKSELAMGNSLGQKLLLPEVHFVN